MGKQLRTYVSRLEGFGKKYQVLSFVAFVLLVLAIAHPLYFKNYFKPAAPYWDEIYHIPSAAKYIRDVHFMEPHPPLGKMLIAWGEELLTWGETNFGWRANGGNTHGLELSDYAPLEMPEGFTFAGYRLFPALAGWLNALLFALVLVELLGSRTWALAFLPLYLFDNALITHSRGAMLDSLMLFGSQLCIWGFLRTLNLRKELRRRQSWALFVMVFGFAFAVMTKVLALVLILLWPALWWIKRKEKGALSYYGKASLAQAAFFFLFGGAVWAYHIDNSRMFVPTLGEGGFYRISSDYENILLGRTKPNFLVRYWVGLRDNLKFFAYYQRGVEKYNLNKGHYSASYPVTWPFGARPVFYRRNYPDEPESRFLVMLPNFAIWITALLGLGLAFGSIGTAFLQGRSALAPRKNEIAATFLLIYMAYMVAVSTITRALFLYHYFIPLLLTFFLWAMYLQDFAQGAKTRLATWAARCALIGLPVLYLGLFLYNRPLSYFEPISCESAYRRLAIPYWGVELSFCADPDAGNPPKASLKSKLRSEAPL